MKRLRNNPNKACFALLSAVLATAGCSSAPEGAPFTERPSPTIFETGSVDGPLVIALESRDVDFENAGITGVVEWTDGDECVTIDGQIVAWPPGTTWDDASSSIVLRNGLALTNGDSVFGGGGNHNLENLLFFLAEDGVAKTSECGASRGSETWIFNGGDNPIEKTN